MPLLDEGYSALRTADQIELIRSELDAELARRGFVGAINYDRDILLGALTAVMADRLGDLGELTQAMYSARDPNNATGAQLSALALATGITRNEPTPSVVTLTLGGTPGTVIPSGRTVRGGGVDGTALWDSRANATIGLGGTVDVDFEAQEPGATLAPAGTAWELISPVYGWQTATNAIDATPGANRETDDELRLRRQESLQIAGTASARSIRARLLEVDGVQAAAVLENPDGLPTTIEGLALDPFAVGAVVYPDTLDDAQKTEVVRTIYENVAAGIQTSGSEAATVLGLDLAPKEIRWSFPVEILVGVTIEIEMEPESTTYPDPPLFADVQPVILAAAQQYGIGLGADVRRLPLLGLASVAGVRSADVVLAPGDPSRLQPTGDVLIYAAERAILSPISVVQV
jgi:uncharacterized phage protein gp47/JayE